MVERVPDRTAARVGLTGAVATLETVTNSAHSGKESFSGYLQVSDNKEDGPLTQSVEYLPFKSFNIK